ncbi:MAG: hypothetical protein ACO32I_06715, partial [Candidatus Limnocylindrus sp.]
TQRADVHGAEGPVTIDEMLRAIHDCGCKEPATKCGCWAPNANADKWHAEAGPVSWAVDVWPSGSCIVERESGWYQQQGDADDFDGAVKLARAMDAAHDALGAAFRAALREVRG